MTNILFVLVICINCSLHILYLYLINKRVRSNEVFCIKLSSDLIDSIKDGLMLYKHANADISECQRQIALLKMEITDLKYGRPVKTDK